MKRRRIAAAGLLLLAAGCHRAPVGDAPDADADLRAKTAAKTSADLAAADAAARKPLPRIVAPPRQSDGSDGGTAGTSGKDDDVSGSGPAAGTVNGADDGIG